MKKFLTFLFIVATLCLILCSCGEHVHKFGEWTVTKNPTCAVPGEQERVCSCGEKQTQAIPMTEHTPVTDPAIPATCTATGLTEGSHCSVCGVVLTKQNETPKDEHTWDSGIITSQPTCTETGVKTYTCSVCETTKTESIDALGHKWDSGIVTSQPTCTEKGVKTYTCSVCGTTKTESIDALGHDLDSSGKCKRCGEISISMTYSERSLAESVTKMDYKLEEFSDGTSLYVGPLNSRGSTVKVPAIVEIKIVNSKNQTVYSNSFLIKGNDYKYYMNGASGAYISIKPSDIEPGYSTDGTMYITLKNPGYFSFSTSVSLTKELPWTVDVKLPNLPETIVYYNSNNTRRSACVITNITYEVKRDSLYIYFTGEKTYDEKGAHSSDVCYVGWKLYDSEGFIVKSGTLRTNSIATGEKFRNESSIVWSGITFGESYRLEILDIR